jgi:CheY-like chemotaxis protein
MRVLEEGQSVSETIVTRNRGALRPVESEPGPARRPEALLVGSLTSGRRLLEALQTQCEVVEVPGTAQALELLKLRPFQAVFIDSQMPGLSPADLDQLRLAAPNTPKAVAGPPETASLLNDLSEAGEFTFLSTGSPAEILSALASKVLFPRTSDRVAFLTTDYRVRGSLEGRLFRHRLLDLSNKGLSFVLDPGTPLDGLMPGASVTDLTITGPDGAVLFGPAQGRVRHCGAETTPLGLAVKVGISIEAPSDSRTPHYRISKDPLDIAANFRKAARGNAPFVLTLPDSDESTEFAKAEVTLRPYPMVRLSGPAPEGVQVHDALKLSVSFHGQSFTGMTSVIDLEEGVALALPRSVRVHHRRSSNRHQPTAVRPYSVRLRSRLTGRDDQYPVFDLNAQGIAIVIDREQDLLPPGLQLDEVEILLPDGTTLSGAGVVRALSSVPRKAGVSGNRPARCGIELTGMSAEARHKLGASLLADGFPHTELAQESDFDAIWKFVPEAGFKFHLFSDNTPESLQTIRNGWGRLLGPAKALGFNILFRHESQIRGSITAIKTNPHTYLATHLAAQQSPVASGERVSRALTLSIMEQFERRADLRYYRFIWKKEQRWANHMFGWPGRALPKSEPRAFVDFLCMVRPNKELPVPSAEGLPVVQEARPGDLLTMDRYFLETTNLLRLLSEDLTAEGFGLRKVGEEYAASGMYRRRLVRTVRVDGMLAGFSLLERSTPGVHLNEFLNSFDVYTMPWLSEQQSAAVRQSLITDAVRFYSAEGLPYSVAMTTSEDAAPFLAQGFRPGTVLRQLTLQRSAIRTHTDLLDLLFSRRNEMIPNW